jgi:WD40 repeat protein
MQPVDFYTDFNDAVEKVLIARNGAVIACGVDGTVRMFRAGEPMTLVGHTDEVNTIALSSDQRILASGSRDYTIRLWDTVSGELLGMLEGHTDWVRVVGFHPTEPLMFSASRDRSVRVWDVSDPVAATVKMAFQHGGDVRSAAFDASGEVLAAGSTDAAIHIWSPVTGERLASLEAHTMPVMSLAFHPNNNLLASGGGDNQVILWGIGT